MNHARFLMVAIYILKIVILEHQLPRGLVTPNILDELKRMAKFIAIYYTPWFLQARLASKAPQLDIQLWKDMCYYENVDSDIGSQVKISLLRHLWYLTQELVVFALFDRDLPDETKQQIASTLRRVQRPATFPPGKPIFPKEKLEQAGSNIQLKELIGPQSWLLFHLLDARGAWLATAPNRWVHNREYKRMYKVVENIEVVNDAAERGVKDVKEYAKVAKDGRYHEQIILVSSSHRIKIPSFHKNEMENNL